MIQKLKNTFLNFGYILPLSLSFLLPFGINYTLIIIIWAIFFLFFNDTGKALKNVFYTKWSYVLIGYFLIHAIGYFFSENKGVALFAIEKKLGFLIFPLFIFSSAYTTKQVNKIIDAFIAACILSSLFCIARTIYRYFADGVNDFYYKEFSYFLHPSYFAMYLIFAIILLILVVKRRSTEVKRSYIYSIFLLFIVAIYFCSSKMGLLSALLVLPLTFIISEKVNAKILSGTLLILVAGLFVTNKFFPEPFDRMKMAANVMFSKKAIDKSDVESTAVRILIWEESMKIIKENFLFGTTPGDLTDKLNEAYQKNGLTGAYANSLNAHNQFLQTFIGTGIIGFILLLLMTVYALVYAIIRKYYLLALFSLLVICNFMVESMLQVHAGVIFFVFFFCLLIRYDLTDKAERRAI